MSDQCSHYPVKVLCEHLKISAGRYYAWRCRKPSVRLAEDQRLLAQIQRIYTNNHEAYGSPRVHQALRQQGIFVGRKRVERLMREAGLQGRVRQVYRNIARKHPIHLKTGNKRLELAKPTAPDQHWAADLTYIRHQGRWFYLVAVLDLYSRKIVGWSMGWRKTNELTNKAIRGAFEQRQPAPGLIFHTDRGVEFVSYEIQGILQKHNAEPSMNRAGQCTDNAEMESFFHSFKAEWVKNRYFSSERNLRAAIKGYIQDFYNPRRLHSSLGYCSPDEFEAMAL